MKCQRSSGPAMLFVTEGALAQAPGETDPDKPDVQIAYRRAVRVRPRKVRRALGLPVSGVPSHAVIR
jgi:hypothetical protein